MNRSSTQLNPLTYPLALAGLLLLLGFGLPAFSAAYQNPNGPDCIPADQGGSGPPPGKENCEDGEEKSAPSGGNRGEKVKGDEVGSPLKEEKDCYDLDPQEDEPDPEPSPTPELTPSGEEKPPCIPDLPDDLIPKDPCEDWKDTGTDFYEKPQGSGELGPDPGPDPDGQGGSSSYGDTDTSSYSSDSGEGGIGEADTTEADGDCGEVGSKPNMPPEEEDCGSSKDGEDQQDDGEDQQDQSDPPPSGGDSEPPAEGDTSPFLYHDGPLPPNEQYENGEIDIDWSTLPKAEPEASSDDPADPDEEDPASNGDDQGGGGDPGDDSGDGAAANDQPEDGEVNEIVDSFDPNDPCPPEGSGGKGGGGAKAPTSTSGGYGGSTTIDPSKLGKPGSKVGKDGNPEEDPNLAALFGKFGGSGSRTLWVLTRNGTTTKSGLPQGSGSGLPTGVVGAPAGDDGDDLEEEIERLGSEIEEINEVIDEINENLEGLQKELISAPTEAEKKRIREWIEALKKKKDKAQADKDEKKKRLDRVRTLKELEELLKEVEEELEELKIIAGEKGEELKRLLGSDDQEYIKEVDADLQELEHEIEDKEVWKKKLEEAIKKQKDLLAKDPGDDDPEGGGDGPKGGGEDPEFDFWLHDPNIPIFPIPSGAALDDWLGGDFSDLIVFPDKDGDGIPDKDDKDIDGDGIPNIGEDGQPLDPDIDGDGIANQHKHLAILLDTPQRIDRVFNPEDHEGMDPDNDGDGKPNTKDSTPDGPGSELEALAFYDPRETATLATSLTPLAEQFISSAPAALANASPPAPVDDVEPPEEPDTPDEPEDDDWPEINIFDLLGSAKNLIAAGLVLALSDSEDVGKGSVTHGGSESTPYVGNTDGSDLVEDRKKLFEPETGPGPIEGN